MKVSSRAALPALRSCCDQLRESGQQSLDKITKSQSTLAQNLKSLGIDEALASTISSIAVARTTGVTNKTIWYIFRLVDHTRAILNFLDQAARLDQPGASQVYFRLRSGPELIWRTLDSAGDRRGRIGDAVDEAERFVENPMLSD